MQFKGRILNFLVQLVTIFVYGALGGVMFMYVENHGASRSTKPNLNDTERRSALNKLKDKHNCQLHNISDSELKSLAQAVLNIMSKPEQPKEWTYTDAIQLVFETLTTIGYGSTPPTTETNRILIIFYALAGIPLFMYFLQIVGEIIHRAIGKAIRLVENKFIRIKEPKSVELKCLIGFTIALVVYLLSMAAVVSHKNGWSYVDSLYALFITITTVGFGDFIFKGSNSVIIVVGLCLMSGLFNSILSYVDYTRKQAIERRNLQNKTFCCFGKKNKVVENENVQENHEHEDSSSKLVESSSL